MCAFLGAFMCVILYCGSIPAYAAKPVKKDFTVVIDAGHGGHDTGAIDHGAREKDINLGVAKKLQALLSKKMKNVKVVMTRSDDRFITLQDRANIANRNHGDLFISIHTNSVDKKSSGRNSVKGTSVYALGLHKDQNNLKVAQRENSVIELESNYAQKYSGFDPSKDESYIIFEMAQKKNLGQSLKFAGEAQKQLVKKAGRADRGVKQAGFWVLWATSMPAVLVELDFICNPTEAAYLNSDRGQSELAEALYNAVNNYVASTEHTGSRNTAVSAESDKSFATSDGEGVNEAANGQSVAVLNSQAYTVATPRKHRADSKDGNKGGASANRREYAYSDSRAGKEQSGNARRRRSSVSKKASESRNVEAEKIEVRKENAYLAHNEVIKVTSNSDSKSETVSNTKKQKKGKSKNKKENKKKVVKNNSNKLIPDKVKADKVKADKAKADKVKADKAKADKAKAEKAKAEKAKVDKVKINNTSVGNSKSNYANERKSNKLEPVHKTDVAPNVPASGATAGRGAVVYTIQLLESDKELSLTDKSFGGLTPNDSFQENGKYKYTYGNTSDRAEIEELLMKVKSLVPEAFIIVK
ncbi:MAG: N-acetylmuramoyl-L-alanine amidase [Candidatus Amulumruptor caecigallinarius]|nr:N-acetylmuramoyl-L-alanine amidase [Candidatus Amulumruptor caecigallinarius]